MLSLELKEQLSLDRISYDGTIKSELENSMTSACHILVKAFDNVVFKKAVLEVHGAIKNQFCYHLIQTIDRN